MSLNNLQIGSGTSDKKFQTPLLKLFLLALAMFVIYLPASAQVHIGSTNYTTLGAAFSAINAGTYTGNITVTITGNTTESATAYLTGSGNGSANYTSVTIYPTAVAKISGNFAGALIELRGADNVVFDGRINQTGSTQSLTLQNDFNTYNPSSVSYACTIGIDSLYNGGTDPAARNDTIRYCNVYGGSALNPYCYDIYSGSYNSSAPFATAGPQTGTNPNLAIMYNNIGRAVAGIYIYGVPTSYFFTGTNISYNNIGSVNSEFTISCYCIFMYGGYGATITNNYICNVGGMNPGVSNCYAIVLQYVNGTTASNNTVTNSTNVGQFQGIYSYYCTNNLYSNNQINNIKTYTACYLLYSYYNTGCTFSNNTIHDIYTTSSTMYGIYSYYYNNTCLYTNNTFYNLKCGSAFYGIYAGNYQTSTTFSNNVFYNLNIASTAYLVNYYGYYLCTGVVFTGNIWHDIYCTSSIQGLYFTGYSSTPSTSYGMQSCTITNNSVYNLYCTGVIYGFQIMYYNNLCLVSGNKFYNFTGTSTMYGMYLYGGSSSYYMTSCTFTNNYMYNYTTSGQIIAIDLYYYNTGCTISYNSMYNLVSTSSTVYGIYDYYYNASTNIVNNIIHDLSAYYTVYGIYSYYDATSVTIANNKIYSLLSTYSGGSGYYAYGMYIYYPVLPYVYNNAISDLKTSYNYASSSSPYIQGIYMYYPQSLSYIYNNSVYLTGANNGANAAGQASACLYFYYNSSYITYISNNAFINTMTSAYTSYFYPVFCSGIFTAGSLVNYNDIYNSTYVGYYNGSLYSTLATWRTATSMDANSLSADGLFNTNINLQPASTSSPLYFSGSTGYQYSGSDIDGVGRGTPYMGAYQSYGDTKGPDIICYTPIANQGTTIAPTLSTVNIVDYSGVNVTSGTKPRLYYKRESDANTYNSNVNTTTGWKYVESSSSSSPFSFTPNYTLLYGGVVAAMDTIQYFVIAQDNYSTIHANVNSASFTVTPSTVVLTSTNFPASGEKEYTITTTPAAASTASATMTGTVYVGAGQAYTSLTQPGGLFDAINNTGLAGNLTVYITSDLTSEAGAIPLYQWKESGAGNYYLTIMPNSATNRTISGAYWNRGMIRLFGADRVVIDGRFGGSGNYLTFRNTLNTGLTYNTSVFQLVTSANMGGNACNNVTIRNCNIYNFPSYLNNYLNYPSTSYNYEFPNPAIYAGGLNASVASNVGNELANLTITQNVIKSSAIGMVLYGSSSSASFSNYWAITSNTLGSSSITEMIGMWGIFAGYYLQYANISNNYIYNVNMNYTYSYMMNYSYGVPSLSAFSASYPATYYMYPYYDAMGIDINYYVSSSTFSNNIITNIYGPSYGAVGIAFYNSYGTGISPNNYMCNNSITNIYGNGNSSYIYGQACGIFLYYPYYYSQFNNNYINNIQSTQYTASSSYPGGAYGIYQLYSAYYCSFNSNTITNLNCNTNGTAVGIVSYSSGASCTFNNNVIANVTGIQASTTYYNTAGLYLYSNTGGATHYIINNMISNVKNNAAGGTYASAPCGIYWYANSTTSIYNNTINLFGNRDELGAGGTTSPSACLLIASFSGNLDIRNNIFVNTQTAGNTSSAFSYAFYEYASGPSYYTNCDYNNYDASGINSVLAYNGSSNVTTLSGISTMTGYDTHSTIRAVEFYNQAIGDLHLTGLSNNDAIIMAPTVPLYSTLDRDGETRRAISFMGADEILATSFKFSPDLTQYSGVICEGSSVVLSATPVVTYQDGINRTITTTPPNCVWYDNGTVISGQTGASLSFTPVYVSNSGTYYAVESFDGLVATTKTSTLNVQKAIALSGQTASTTFCNTSSNPTLTVAVDGTVNSMNWQQETNYGYNNYTNIPGATTNSYVVTLANLPIIDASTVQQGARYRLVVQGPGNCGNATVYGTPIQLNEFTPLSNNVITSNALNDEPCSGSDLILTCNAVGSIFSYQWQYQTNSGYINLDMKKYPTAQSRQLTVPEINANLAGYYRCVITGCPTCGTSTSTSADFYIKVLIPEYFVAQTKSQSICKGEASQFYVSLLGEGTVNAYQWQKDGVDIDPTKTPSAAKSMLLIDSAIYDMQGVYRCKVSVTDCAGDHEIYSDGANLNVLEPLQITEYTKVVAAPIGGIAKLIVKSHAFDNPSYDYVNVQWYKGAKPLTNGARIAGAQSSIMTIKDIKTTDIGTDYWVVVSGDCGSATATGIEITTSGVTIATQPVSATICEGSTYDMSVVATPVGLVTDMKYQWLFNNAIINDNEDYIGTDKATLTFKNATLADAGSYTVQVTGTPGNVIVTSLSAKITVKALPVITSDLPSTSSVKVGDPLKLICEATSADALTYSWYKDGVAINTPSSATYLVTASQLTDAGTYQCKVTNACGTISSNNCVVTVSTGLPNSVTDNNVNNAINVEVVPNPFTTDANIKLTVNTSSKIKVTLNNTLGQQIKVLSDKFYEIGPSYININPMDLNLTVGVYYLIIESDNQTITKQVVFIK